MLVLILFPSLFLSIAVKCNDDSLLVGKICLFLFNAVSFNSCSSCTDHRNSYSAISLKLALILPHLFLLNSQNEAI